MFQDIFNFYYKKKHKLIFFTLILIPFQTLYFEKQDMGLVWSSQSQLYKAELIFHVIEFPFTLMHHEHTT